MAMAGVIIVPWAVEIRGHQANSIKIMLKPQRSAELNSRDLGDGIPLIGRL